MFLGKTVHHETQPEVTKEENNNPVSEELLEVLGEQMPADQPQVLSFSEEFSKRGVEWRDNGVKPEILKEIMEKYPRDNDCCYLEAPKLNAELNKLTKTAKSRDGHFVATQNQVGSALVAIGNALNLLIKKEEEEVDITKLLRYLWDSGKILVNAHFELTKSRKSFIIPVLDPKFKEVAEEAKTDKFLFGEKFNEGLKASTAMDKLGKDLLSTNQVNKTSLNHSGASRKY